MTYAISYDEENWKGDFATEDEAIAVALLESDHFWIGKNRPPKQPETFVDADTIIGAIEDEIIGEEDWYFDWVPDWKGWKPNERQKEELTIRLRRTIGAWLDRHNLRPAWFVVDDVVEYIVVDGKAVAAKEAEELNRKILSVLKPDRWQDTLSIATQINCKPAVTFEALEELSQDGKISVRQSSGTPMFKAKG